MVSLTEAHWKIRIIENPEGMWSWIATTDDDIGIEEFEIDQRKWFPNYESALANWASFSIRNNNQHCSVKKEPFPEDCKSNQVEMPI